MINEIIPSAVMVNTKFKVGNTAFYFDKEYMKLIPVIINEVHINVHITDTSSETIIEYTLDMAVICKDKCQLVDATVAWLSSDGNIEFAKVPEDSLFKSKEEFMNIIDPPAQYLDTENNIRWGSEIKLPKEQCQH